MDLFFEIYGFLREEGYLLARVFRCSDNGAEMRIYCDDKLIVFVKHEDYKMTEYVYLMSTKHLIQWALRNEYHASGSARKESQWITKLKEQLGAEDDEHNSGEGWEMLSMPDAE